MMIAFALQFFVQKADDISLGRLNSSGGLIIEKRTEAEAPVRVPLLGNQHDL